MPQQATIRAWREFAEREPEFPQDIDYEAEYRALDLPPGAALREIQDRARLLAAAFYPDGLPGSLQVPAAERAMRIVLAADRLSRYWRRHGAPPPRAAPAVERRAPRLHVVAEPVQPRARSDTARGTGGEQSAALRAAIAARSLPQRGGGRPQEPQQRRPLATLGSLLLKLAMAALVIAAIARVQEYRAEHPSLGVYFDPNTATATGMPGEPPVRWAGLPVPGRQVIGAAAPAIVGRHRQD